MVRCEDIFEKKSFTSYSEFYLALCIGAACKEEGTVLDMSNMIIERDILPRRELDYFKYLLSVGSIYIEGVEQGTALETTHVSLYVDVSNFSKLGDKLFDTSEGKYKWSVDWAVAQYGEFKNIVANMRNLPSTLMHLVAYMILKIHLGTATKKPIEIYFDLIKSKNTHYYVNIYSCKRSMSWFDKMVILDIDFSYVSFDIDYSIHYNNGLAAKRINYWSVGQKKEIMKSLGFVEGSILVLWTRGNMNESNVLGKITGTTLMRLDEILENDIAVTTFLLNRTKEETRRDYYSIPEHQRYKYVDLLTKPVSLFSSIINLHNLGIENYFMHEDRFITAIDPDDYVTKVITVEGEEVEVELSAIDAIYWLMCQYCIDFDRELYKSMYNKGEELMWDKYGVEEEDM